MDNNSDEEQNEFMEEQNEFMIEIEQFLPQLEICKKKIHKKMDMQAEKLQKYKLYKAKIQRHIDMYTQQYAIIERDLEILQVKLQSLNGQFLKSKVSDLKNLKEDAGKLLEVFVYIQTGKENSFENVKSYFQKQNTIDLNLNFMDYSSIDLIKVQDIWKNRTQIQDSILSQKQYSKYQSVLKQLLEWILTFYEIIIKQEILQSIESMYQEYQEKKEQYSNQFTKNEFIYKYYRQLYQQLQNYINAIQEKNPLIDETFAESLTKLIEEIFRKDNPQREDPLQANARNQLENVRLQNNDQGQQQKQRNKSNTDFQSRQQQYQTNNERNAINVPHRFAKSPSPSRFTTKAEQKDHSEMKLMTVVTVGDRTNDHDQDQEGQDNTSFKKLLNDHKFTQAKKRTGQLIQLENIEVQDKENGVYKAVLESSEVNLQDTQAKMFSRLKSNSTHNLNLYEQSNNNNNNNNNNPFQLNNSVMNNYEQEKQSHLPANLPNLKHQTISELIQAHSKEPKTNSQKYSKIKSNDLD